MEKTEASNKKVSVAIKMLIRQVAFVVLVSLVSACVTTGGSSNQVKKVVKQNCGPGTVVTPAATATNSDGDSPAEAPGTASPDSKPVNPNNCLPKGVIEISEQFGVDPKIRGEFNQAVMLLNQQNYSEAIKLLLAVAGKTSKFSAPYINLGIAYARTEDMEKAEENLKKALDINNQHPVAQNELGLVYRKTGRYVEARQLYETLLALYPDFLPARKNLGVLCDIYIQDLNCALEQYEEYLRGIPEDEKVKIWVADVKSRM
ncbi:tetratricopeptide repeat protein [Kaarinaea lacus]